MPFTVELLPDLPVVVVNVIPPQSPDEPPLVNAEVAALIAEQPGQFYRMADLSAVNINWDTMQSAFAVNIGEVPGSVGDPRLIPVIVGGGDMPQVAADGWALEMFGGKVVRVFPTRAEGLAWIRRDLVARGG